MLLNVGSAVAYLGFFASAAVAGTSPAISGQSTQNLYTISSGSMQVTLNGGTGALTLTTASSSNTAVLPTSSVTCSGSGSAGSTRTVYIATGTGTASGITVTLLVTDAAGATGTATFTVNVYTLPAVSAMANQTTTVGTALSGVAFTTSGNRGNLALSYTSSNTSVIPASGGVTFDNANAPAGARTLSIAAPLSAGTSTVTVSANDGVSSGSTSFVVTVNALPAISGQSTQNLYVNYTRPIQVTLSGGTGALTLTTASSSNTAVLPTSSVTCSGSGSTRTVTISSGANTGTSTVTLRVTDAAGATSTASFTINVAATPLDAWRMDHFGTNANNSNIAGNNADPDGDGAPNWAEWALNTDPLIPNASLTSDPFISNGSLCLTYRRPINAPGVTYAPEYTADLANWSVAGITQQVTASDGTIETITVQIPIASGGRGFLHLRVSMP